MTRRPGSKRIPSEKMYACQDLLYRINELKTDESGIFTTKELNEFVWNIEDELSDKYGNASNYYCVSSKGFIRWCIQHGHFEHVGTGIYRLMSN